MRGGFDVRGFAANGMAFDAGVRNLQVIGEAARRLDDDVKDLCPDVSWRKIVGLRHIVVHAYADLHELLDRVPEEGIARIRPVLEKEAQSNGHPEDRRSALEKAEALGVVGCVEGPADLSANPEYMADYGK